MRISLIQYPHWSSLKNRLISRLPTSFPRYRQANTQITHMASPTSVNVSSDGYRRISSLPAKVWPDIIMSSRIVARQPTIPTTTPAIPTIKLSLALLYCAACLE